MRGPHGGRLEGKGGGLPRGGCIISSLASDASTIKSYRIRATVARRFWFSSKSPRNRGKVERRAPEMGFAGLHRFSLASMLFQTTVRSICKLRIWVSEGLAQSNSYLQGAEFLGPQGILPEVQSQRFSAR